MDHRGEESRRATGAGALVVPAVLITTAVAAAAVVAFASASPAGTASDGESTATDTTTTTTTVTTTTTGTSGTTTGTTEDAGTTTPTETAATATETTTGAAGGAQAGGAVGGETLPSGVIAIPWVMPVVRRLAVAPGVVRAGHGRVRVVWVQSSEGPVSLRLERLLPGRRLATRCVAPALAPRSARACARVVRVRLRTVAGREGLNRVVLAGPGLTRGRYRVTARPRDPGGNLGSSRFAAAVVR